MRGFLAARWRSAGRSLIIWPDLKGWVQCAAIAGVGTISIGVIAALTGLIRWQVGVENPFLLLLIVFFVPALGEELVFRGLLTPERGETRRPALFIGLGVVLFILWHVFEALTFLPQAQVFMTPAFLLCAGVLGLSCALMRYLTGSLWSAVVFHAVVVWGWKAFLSGPKLF